MGRSRWEFAGWAPSGGLQPGSQSSPVKFYANVVLRKDLQKGVDEVHKQLKDPVEGSKSGDVNVNVADVADVEVGQLQSSTVGNVHLEIEIDMAQNNL